MPNGAEENFRWGDRREPPFFYFYKERLGTGSPPHPTRLRRPTFPPEGKALGVGRTLPVCETTSPSPPSRWAGRYGRKIQGRRPGKKEGSPPQGPPNQKRWVQGGRTSSSLVFFPPAFFQRKPGPRPGPGGQRGAAPRGGFRGTTQRARSTGLSLTGGPGLNQRRAQRERPAETSGGNAQGGLPAGKAALGNEVLFCCLLSTHFKMLAYDL